MFGSGAVGRLGWIQPFLATGAVLSTVGASLIYTLDRTSSARNYIGHQIIAGAGFGLAIQVPIVAINFICQNSDISVATSTTLFFNFLGTAVGVSVAESIFNNRMLARIPPAIGASEVLNTGAYQLLETFSQTWQYRAVEDAYVVGLKAARVMSVFFRGCQSSLPSCQNGETLKARHSD